MKYRILFILLLCGVQNLYTKRYKIKPVSMDRCKIPEDKYDKSEPVVYFYNVRKVNRRTTLISANFTVKRNTGPIMLNLKLYRLTKTNSRELVFKMEKLDCHNPFTYQLFRVLHVKMDTECIAAPGFYRTADMNLQDFAWVLNKSIITPGRYIYSFEAYLDKGGVLVCCTVTSDITLAK